MIENIKARFRAKRFNIWTERIDETNREGYFIYNDTIYYGQRFGVFQKSVMNESYKRFKQPNQ